MDKRKDLRSHFQREASRAESAQQHKQRTAQLSDFENTVIDGFNALIKFIDGKTTKTEVVNQLKSISTPDVDKVVVALSKLDRDVLSNKIDLQPLVAQLGGIKREMSLVPKSLPKIPEAKDAVKVTNLSEIVFDTSAIEKAIKGLKLDPKIDVKSPDIKVEKPDLKPLQDLLLDLLKAVQKIEIPEVPETDLKTLEKEAKDTNKKLDEANKKLQKIVDKPVGGGGGGGNGTPYQSDGKASYVELETDGSIPVTVKNSSSSSSGKPTDAYALSNIDDTTTTEYYGYEDKDGKWYIKRLVSNTFTFSAGSSNYSAAWTGRASQTYASYATTF